MDSSHSEVYQHYLEISKPTKEDFERVFSEEELKKLCLKKKCRVDMWRWNVVEDYRIQFRKSGRFQRWSESLRLAMLAKGVNKMKPRILYDEEAIQKTRKEEWGFLLKDNILSLNLWQRERLREAEDLDSNSQALSSFGINSESMTEELLIPNALTIPEPRLTVEVLYEPVTDGIVLTETPQDHQFQHEDHIPTERLEICTLNNHAEYESDDHCTNDSVDTILRNKILPEPLHSEDVAPEIANIYRVNTISMTLDSEIVQSQDLPVLQSQDVIPASYDNFEGLIPLTSTQSNTEPSEEILPT